MTSEDFKLLLDQIVEADVMNVFGYSVARPGYGLVEVALDPHRSTRTTLSIAQKLLDEMPELVSDSDDDNSCDERTAL
jgi:hypothetical protein